MSKQKKTKKPTTN